MNSIGSARAEVILVPEDLFARALPIECFSLTDTISLRCERKLARLVASLVAAVASNIGSISSANFGESDFNIGRSMLTFR
jgi:hypothetical protein